MSAGKKGKGKSKQSRDPGRVLQDILCLPVEGEPQKSRRGKLRKSIVRGAKDMVANGGVMDQIRRYQQEDNPNKGTKGGRPPLADEEVVLVLLIALVSIGEAPLVTNIANAYRSRLGTGARRILGLPDVEKTPESVIYFRVYRALNRILKVLDPYPGPRRARLTRAQLEQQTATWESAECVIDGKIRKVVDIRLERLRTVTNLLLESAFLLLPTAVQDSWQGNICIDATVVRAGGKVGSPSNKKSPKPSDKMSVVAGTGWYTRQDESGKTIKSAWGYEAHLVVMGANIPGETPDFPLLVLGMSLDTPATRIGENAVIAAESVISRGHPAGLCAADRAYFPNSTPENYQLPMRALGYSLIGDYRVDQLGIQTQRDGAILVEGTWYCPSMPEPLINATKDLRRGAISKSTYKSRISQRAQYAFRPKQSPTPDGNIVYLCPAVGSGATAQCPLKPALPPGKKSLTLIVNPPSNPDKACTNVSSITLPIAPDPTSKSADDPRAKYYQDLRYATPDWRTHWAMLRNTIEGTNGYNKDPNWSDIEEPGRRRLRSFAGQALLLACQILASNLRKMERFMLKRLNPPSPSPLSGRLTRRHRTTPDLTRHLPPQTGPPLAEPA